MNATTTFTREELEADIAFLLVRAGQASMLSFGDAGRFTGMSSNALVNLAYGGKQDWMPYDRSDYAACVRSYVRLPKHRKTKEVRKGLAKARAAYLAHYPEHATAASRNAARADLEAKRAAENSKKRRRR
ncbi:hypothetical protein V5F34_00850 [Xanthobacter autotrophicus]|uniref:hypothetical protein n=1 Tax=Xanthobacter autotrophicus TaxID=280 RepID=UPI0037292E73